MSKPFQPELSLVIVSYNTKDVTVNCINSIVKSLSNSHITYEIVVVDNASTDGSVKMLKRYMLHATCLRLIESKENLGFGKGNNLGVKHAAGEYVLFLNSDILVLDRAIEKLLEYYKSQNSYKFIGGKLLNKDMTLQPSCGPFYRLFVTFTALFLRGDYWGLTRYSPSKSKKVDWVSGACMMTTKKIFEELSGFDKDIFMYMEEVDLLYRAKRAGYFTGFYPEAHFIHLGSMSSQGRTYPILQVYKGFLYFYKKHFSPPALIFLKFMLQLKAVIGVILGRLTSNRYLIDTYEKAFKIASLG